MQNEVNEYLSMKGLRESKLETTKEPKNTVGIVGSVPGTQARGAGLGDAWEFATGLQLWRSFMAHPHLLPS